MESRIRTRWLSGQEACRYIGRSDEWLRRKVNAGLIRFSIDPSNGRKVYDAYVLDKFIKPVAPLEYIKKNCFT